MPDALKEYRQYREPDSSEIVVSVDGYQLIATLPGTSFVAAYHKQPNGEGIVQGEATMDDSAARISRRDFEDLAWDAANRKARELGWIDQS